LAALGEDLRDVPFERLQTVNVYEWPPARFRLCPTCFPLGETDASRT
jgi:hypothetical protein